MSKDLADGYSIRNWWRSVLATSKSEKTEQTKEDKLRSHRNLILLNIFWIGLMFLKGGFALKDGWKFLFEIDKSFTGDDSLYLTKSEIWYMHTGVITIFAVTAFSALLVTHVIAFIKLKKEIKKREPAGIVNGEAAPHRD